MRTARWALVMAWFGLVPLAACARRHGSDASAAPIPSEALRPDASAGTMALDSSLPLLPLVAADAGGDPLARCQRPRMLISFGEPPEAVCFDLSEFAGWQSSDDAGADDCPAADAFAWPSVGERCSYLPVCDDVLPEGRPVWGATLSTACCYWVQHVCGV